jgi:hypothetical protein
MAPYGARWMYSSLGTSDASRGLGLSPKAGCTCKIYRWIDVNVDYSQEIHGRRSRPCFSIRSSRRRRDERTALFFLRLHRRFV